MNKKFALIPFAFLAVAISGCGSSEPQAPIIPSEPFTPEQVIQIQNEDDRVAFEESQGSIQPSGNK
jgi:hypothetical protein